jgi:tape measure domain-containing protein
MTGVIVDVKADTTKAVSDLDKLRASVGNIEQSVGKTTAAFGTMAKGIAASVGILVGGSYLQKVSDDFARLANRINAVTDSNAEFLKAQTKVIQIAQQTRASIEVTSKLYGKLSGTLRDAGGDTAQLGKLTKAVSQTMAISGSSVDSATASLEQFSQAMGRGVLNGDELGSVMEGNLRLARAIADGMSVSVGQLKQLGAEGKLTSDIVLKAIGSQSKKLEKEFASMVPTIEQGVASVSSSMKILTHGALSGLGSTNPVSSFLSSLSKTIDKYSEDITIKVAGYVTTFRNIVQDVGLIVKPLARIATEIGKTLLTMLPEIAIVRTWSRDLRTVMLGGLAPLVGFFKGIFNSILSGIGSSVDAVLHPVTLALRQLLAIDFSFSRKALLEYSKGLENLADALAKSRAGFFFQRMAEGSRELGQAFHSAVRYFGGYADTLITIFPSVSKAFTRLSENVVGVFAQIVRQMVIVRYAVADALGVFGPLFQKIVAGGGGIDRILDGVDMYARATGAIARTALIMPILFNKFVGGVLAFMEDVDMAVLADGFAHLSDTIKGIITPGATFASVMLSLGRAAKQALALVLALFSGIGRAISAAVGRIDLSGLTSGLTGRAADSIRALGDDVVGLADRLRTAAVSVKNFAKDVIFYFFDIWDKVIGHSWWTDTIESVINTSAALLSNVAPSLERFGRYVIGMFRGISEDPAVAGLFSKFVDSAKANVVVQAAFSVVTDFKKTDFYASLKDPAAYGSTAGEIVRSFADRFKAEFPNVFKSVMAGLSTVAIALLFPAGALKNILLGVFGSAFLTASTLLADAFGQDRLNQGLFLTLGTAAGRAAAVFVGGILTQIPSILAGLLDAVGGFVRGFLETIPVLGVAFAALFDTADALGVAGPLGLVGAFFFGKGIAPLLMHFKAFEKFAKGFVGVARTLGVMGATAGEMGFIGRILVGPKGNQIIGVVGLIASSLGFFEHFITNPAVRGLLEIGLLTMMVGGANGATPIMMTIQKAGSALRDLAKAGANKATGGILGDLLLGSKSDRADIMTAGFKFLEQNGKWIHPKAAVLGGVTDRNSLIYRAMLGDGTTEGKARTAATAMMQSFSTWLAGVGTVVGSLFSNAFAGKGGSGFLAWAAGVRLTIGNLVTNFVASQGVALASTASFFAKVKGLVAAMEAFILVKAGKEGFLAKVMGGVGGRSGKLAAAALLAATIFFSGSASAAEGVTEKVAETDTAFHSLGDTISNFVTKNALLTASVGATVAALSVLLVKLAMVGRSKFTDLQAASASFMGPRQQGNTKGKIGIGGGAIAAAATYAGTGDILTSIFSGVAVKEALELLWKLLGTGLQLRIGAMFATLANVGTAAFAALTGSFAAIAVAVVAGLTLGWVAFFGDGATVMERFKNKLLDFKKALGLNDTNNGKAKSDGEARYGGLISDENKKALTNTSVKTDFSAELATIRPKLLSESEVTRVNDALASYNEQLTRATEERASGGQVSEETLATILENALQLEKVLARASGKSQYDLTPYIKDINALRTLSNEGWFMWMKQAGMDLAFYTKAAVAWANLKVSSGENAPDAEARLRQLAVNHEKDNYYNVNRSIPTTPVLDLQASFNMLTKLKIDVQDIPDTTLRAAYADASTKFYEATQTVTEEAGDTKISLWDMLVGNSPEILPTQSQKDDLVNGAAKVLAQVNKEIAAFQIRSNMRDAMATRFGELSKGLKSTNVKVDKTDFLAAPEAVKAQIEGATKQLQGLIKVRDLASTPLEIRTANIDVTAAEAALNTLMTQTHQAATMSRADIAKAIAAELNLDVPDALFESFSESNMGRIEEGLKRIRDLKANLTPEAQAKIASEGTSAYTGLDVFKLTPEKVAQITASRAAFTAFISGEMAKVNTDVAASAAPGSVSLFELAGISLDEFDLSKMSLGAQQVLDSLAEQRANLKSQEPVDIIGKNANLRAIAEIDAKVRDLLGTMRTFSDISAGIGSLGIDFGLSSSVKYSDADINKLVDAAIAKQADEASLRNVDITTDAGRAQFREAAVNDHARSRMAKQLEEARTPRSYQSMFDRFSSAGINVNTTNGYQIDPKTLASYDTLATKIESLKKQMSDAEGGGSAASLQQLKAYSDRVDAINATLGNFGVKFEMIKTAYPDLNLGVEAYNKISLEGQREMLASATELAKMKTKASTSLHASLEDAVKDAAKAKEIARRGGDIAAQTATLSTQFDMVSATFSKLGLTFETFSVMAAPARKEMFDLARASAQRVTELRGEVDATADAAVAVSKLNKAAADMADQVLQKASLFGNAAVRNAAAAGVSLDVPGANRMTGAQAGSLQPFYDRIKASEIILDDPKTQEAARIAAQRVLDATRGDLSKAITLYTLRVEDTQTFQAGKTFAQNMTESFTSGIKDVLKGEKSVGDYISDLATSFADNMIDSAINGAMSALTKQGGMLGGDGLAGIGSSIFGDFADLFGGNGEVVGNPQLDVIAGAQAARDNSMIGLLSQIALQAGVPAAALGSMAPQAAAGAPAGGKSSGGLFSGIGDAFSAAGGYLSSGYESIKGSLFGSTPDFSASNRTGDVSAPQAPSTNSSVFGLGSSITSAYGSTSDAQIAAYGEGSQGIMDTTASGFKGLSSISLSGFGSMAQGLAGLVGGSAGGNAGAWIQLATAVAGSGAFAATGGQIRGPGTGTSDSVRAWLSNGEYVVNAKSTAANLSLLRHLNSGGTMDDILGGNAISKFAIGGLVGGMPSSMSSATTLLPAVGASQSRSDQVFNINVTGDVSRQTRNEIQQMIPRIAVGVNAHNQESGYR